MAEKKKHLIKVQDQLVPVNEEVYLTYYRTVASCGQRRKAASSGKTSWKKKGCYHSDCPNGTGLET